jgi:hypothetical protein
VFTAPTRFDKLFAGIMAPLPAFIDPNDTTGKDGITAEDTHDADYGRLLERVERHVKRGTSPTGFDDLWDTPLAGIMRRE